VASSRFFGHIQPSKCVYFTLQWSWIKSVRPLSAVDNTRNYARVSHSRQWSNYNMSLRENDKICCIYCCWAELPTCTGVLQHTEAIEQIHETLTYNKTHHSLSLDQWWTQWIIQKPWTGAVIQCPHNLL